MQNLTKSGGGGDFWRAKKWQFLPLVLFCYAILSFAPNFSNEAGAQTFTHSVGSNFVRIYYPIGNTSFLSNNLTGGIGTQGDPISGDTYDRIGWLINIQPYIADLTTLSFEGTATADSGGGYSLRSSQFEITCSTCTQAFTVTNISSNAGTIFTLFFIVIDATTIAAPSYPVALTLSHPASSNFLDLNSERADVRTLYYDAPDTTAPTTDITSSTSGNTITWTVTFNENVINIADRHFSVNRGTLDMPSATSGTSITIVSTHDHTTDGDITLTFDGDAGTGDNATDAAGNVAGDAMQTVNIDIANPEPEMPEDMTDNMNGNMPDDMTDNNNNDDMNGNDNMPDEMTNNMNGEVDGDNLQSPAPENENTAMNMMVQFISNQVVQFRTALPNLNNRITSKRKTQNKTSAATSGFALVGTNEYLNFNGNKQSDYLDSGDLWIDGYYTNSDISDSFHLHFGGDFAMNENLNVGLLFQYDDSNFSQASNELKTTGFMFGPYILANINYNLDFTSHLAYGTSEANLTTPTMTSELETTRFLFSTSLARNLETENYIFTPKIKYIYFVDDVKQMTKIKLKSWEASLAAATTINYGQKILTPSITFNTAFDSIMGEEKTTGKIEPNLTLQNGNKQWQIGGHYDVFNEAGDFETYGITASLILRF